MSRTAASLIAAVTAAAALASGIPAHAQKAPNVLTVHTTREKEAIEPLLRVFEGLTSIKVEVVYHSGDPIGRLRADVAAGTADLFIAAELNELVAAKRAGLTEPATMTELAERVPVTDRDEDGHWFGLSRRLRVVAVTRAHPKPGALTYEDLADPRWKGKVCVRSGLHPANVMLVASMIAHRGAAAAETWLRGVKANLAGKPAGGDRDQVASVSAGRCDIALVNSSDIGALRSSKDSRQQAAGNAVEMVFPNADGRGVHVSISGMALLKDAPGVNNAGLLMDFLTTEPAQLVYAQDNFEYPIRKDVKPYGLVESWGSPKLDEIPLATLTRLQPQAVELIGRIGFDSGPGS